MMALEASGPHHVEKWLRVYRYFPRQTGKKRGSSRRQRLYTEVTLTAKHTFVMVRLKSPSPPV